jgi:AdoMet-dependent heme synthase
MGTKDFDQAPFLVIWETTQACDLACKHCRAEAQPDRHPDELTTAEAKKLLEDVRTFRSHHLRVQRWRRVEAAGHRGAGGARRESRAAHGDHAGDHAAGDARVLQALKDAGLSRLAISLDGSHPASMTSSGRWTARSSTGLRILRTSQEIGLTTQVNTVVAKHNLEDFDALIELMTEVGIVFWEVFFLVPMGRARPQDVASAEQFEAVFEKLYDLSKTAPFDIKATAAPQYSRLVLQKKVAERRNGGDTDNDVLTDGAAFSMSDGIGRARNVNDGDGFMFVSHTGDIYPSGFLPLYAGNVRQDDLVDTTAPRRCSGSCETAAS